MTRIRVFVMGTAGLCSGDDRSSIRPRLAFLVRRGWWLDLRTAADRHECPHAGTSGLGVAHENRGRMGTGTTYENGRPAKQTPGSETFADQANGR